MLKVQKKKQNTKKIIEIHDDSKQRYGAPKIHVILENEGYQASLKRVQCLMKKFNIKSIIVKKFHPTSSNEKIFERKNLFHWDFSMKNGLEILRTFTRLKMVGAT